MNGNQQKEIQMDEDIDLRELLITLWKNKIMIITIALVVAIFAALVSIFILKPVYDTDLKININLPETFTTKFGEYKMPATSNKEYVNLIKSDNVILNTIKDLKYSGNVTQKSIKGKIAVNIDSANPQQQSIFDIKVSQNNPDLSLKLAQTLYNNYREYIDAITRERAVNYYYDNISASLEAQKLLLKSTQEIIRKIEEELAKTPETINQRQLQNTGSNVVIENIINPAYTKLQEGMVENKQTLISTKDKIREFEESLKELKLEKDTLKRYDRTGTLTDTKQNILNVADTSIYLLATPTVPTEKTSPSNAKNTAIGLVLGGMLGVIIALIKGYWFKKA